VRVTRTCFIAETDGTGAIAWVWRFTPEERVARPIANPEHVVEDAADADFFGAPREDILAWFEASKSHVFERTRDRIRE